MKLKSYPEYKDSGVPWLGKIPAHWQLSRGKRLFAKMERPVKPDDDVVTCFRDGTVTLRKNRRTTGFTQSLKEIGYQGVRRGDLVIHAMDAFAGAIGVSDSDGKCTPVYSICTPRSNENTRYYAHLLREVSRSQYILSLARGIRERSTDFRFDTFANLFLPIPAGQEQDSITTYLDFKSKQISRFIRNKRRLIELLKEQKQAIISQAVTRGIDPNVRLKPSGFEWLGDIPEHWEVRRLRFLGTKFGSGITPRGGATVYKDSGIPLLRSQNIHFTGLRLDDVAFISDEIHKSMSGTHVQPGDVLLNITGASLGRVCAIPESFKEGNVNQHVCIIRPKKNVILSEYLSGFLSTPFIQHEIYISQNGASREGLSLKALKALPILLPSIHEQLKILNTIKQTTYKIDAAISRAGREIELMREYRTRLIADVVTGKVDVRDVPVEVVPQDWEEVEETAEAEEMEEWVEDGEIQDADE